MIFISIITLIAAKALPLFNKISSIHISRIASIIFIYTGAISFNCFYIQSIGSGIGIYSGLFHITPVSQLMEFFLFFIGIGSAVVGSFDGSDISTYISSSTVGNGESVIDFIIPSILEKELSPLQSIFNHEILLGISALLHMCILILIWLHKLYVTAVGSIISKLFSNETLKKYDKIRQMMAKIGKSYLILLIIINVAFIFFDLGCIIYANIELSNNIDDYIRVHLNMKNSIIMLLFVKYKFNVNKNKIEKIQYFNAWSKVESQKKINNSNKNLTLFNWYDKNLKNLNNKIINKKDRFQTWFLQKWGKNSIFLGAQRAYSLPTLPAKVEKYHNHVFVRIFRFLGGLSFLMVATNINYDLKLPAIVLWTIIIVACIHVTHVIIILLIKFFFSLYTLIFDRKKFEIRNSPLNRFASIFGQALFCIKVGCGATASGAGFLAGGIAYDEMLVNSGRPKVFLPIMGQIFNGVFGEVPPTHGNNNNIPIAIVPNTLPKANPQNVGRVAEMVTKYQTMSPEERIDFMTEINSSYEDEKNKRK